MSIGTEEEYVTLRALRRNGRNSLRAERLVRNKCYRKRVMKNVGIWLETGRAETT
jgi:hypothetical protein